MNDAPEPPDDDLPPIARTELKALFDHLARPDPQPCRHDHALTIHFLTSHGLPVGPTIEWLQRHGAGCDCEVIFNTDGVWGEWAGRTPLREDDA